VVIDLHAHSTASDGTDDPAALMAAASAAGVDVLALTDHDTSAGWAEAAPAALEHGVVLVPGMELSCSLGGISVHLLCYLHDPDSPGLAAEVARARSSRESRARRMVELIARDYPLSWGDVEALTAAGATVGRPHIADALVARGHASDRSAAFAGILAASSGYFVSHYAPDPVAAVRLVRAAGGVPVFAHPAANRRGRTVGDDVIEAMAEAGLAGLEVDHRDHDAQERAHLRDLARALGLLVTGSSDYHGAGKPNVLGEHTTAPEVLRALLDQGSGVPAVRP
jgi:3',5'-nucleoside bisphosphate phosphatase